MLSEYIAWIEAEETRAYSNWYFIFVNLFFSSFVEWRGSLINHYVTNEKQKTK